MIGDAPSADVLSWMGQTKAGRSQFGGKTLLEIWDGLTTEERGVWRILRDGYWAGQHSSDEPQHNQDASLFATMAMSVITDYYVVKYKPRETG